MGYSTDFIGSFNLSKEPTQEQIDFLARFAATRRMKRNTDTLKALYHGEHGLNGDYGQYGEYFAKDDGDFGQTKDASILDYNMQPPSQPSLWCHWILSEDNKLEWDGGEKFYNYVEWLKYFITHFFAKWDIKLNGEIKWQGEDMEDRGKITVVDNIVTITNLE